MALSQTLGKLANKYVNFTVSTIFKCSKALPTMALMVLCGKRYTLANVAAALTMALSAFCFAVGARQADADFNFLGVLLNGLYLLFQALQVALQDSALRDHGASIDETMLYANAIGLAALGCWALGDGELIAAISFFAARPNAVLLLAARNGTFYFAVRYYTAVVKDAGGVAAVTVGIVRKILTVICSLLLFSKPWANIYGVGGLLFAAALAQESRNARTREKLQHSRSSSALADEESPPPPPKHSPRRSPRIDVSK